MHLSYFKQLTSSIHHIYRRLTRFDNNLILIGHIKNYLHYQLWDSLGNAQTMNTESYTKW